MPGESAVPGAVGVDGDEGAGLAAPGEPGAAPPLGRGVVVGAVGTSEDGKLGSDGPDEPSPPVPPPDPPVPVIGANGEPAPVIGDSSDVAPETAPEMLPVSADGSGTTNAVRTAVAGPDECADDVVTEVRPTPGVWLEFVHASTVPAGVAGAAGAAGVAPVLGGGADVGANTDGCVRSGQAEAV